MHTPLRVCYRASCYSYAVFGVMIAALPGVFVPVHPGPGMLLPLCLAQSLLSYATEVVFFPACLHSEWSRARCFALLDRACAVYLGGMLAVLNCRTLDSARFEAIVLSSITALLCFFAGRRAYQLGHAQLYMLLHTVWHGLPVVAVGILAR